MHFRQNMMNFATLLGSLRKGVTLMSVRNRVPAQEKQAEGDAPGDCVCTGCPDNPKKCDERVLSRRVYWTFCCVRQIGPERDTSFLLTC